MANYNVEFGSTSSASRELQSASASIFMARVYRWMVAGLAVTGATAWFVASNEAVFNSIAPYFKVLFFVQIGLVLAFSFLAQRIGAVGSAVLFMTYAFTNGLVFSMLFYIFQLGSVASVFFITAGTFGALSAYGTLTKKDLSSWGTFLFMGLIGVVIAGVVNIFLQSPMLGFVKSCAAVLVFAGLTAYDTQKLRAMHAYAGGQGAAGLAISGALTLYLDFINLFLNLLTLLGRRR